MWFHIISTYIEPSVECLLKLLLARLVSNSWLQEMISIFESSFTLKLGIDFIGTLLSAVDPTSLEDSDISDSLVSSISSDVSVEVGTGFLMTSGIKCTGSSEGLGLSWNAAKESVHPLNYV